MLFEQYPSDFTDEEWAVIDKWLPLGRPREDVRDLLMYSLEYDWPSFESLYGRLFVTPTFSEQSARYALAELRRVAERLVGERYRFFQSGGGVRAEDDDSRASNEPSGLGASGDGIRLCYHCLGKVAADWQYCTACGKKQ